MGTSESNYSHGETLSEPLGVGKWEPSWADRSNCYNHRQGEVNLKEHDSESTNKFG